MTEATRLELRAFRRVDGASLAFFRIGFGMAMIVSVVRFFAYGRIRAYFVAPSFHFTYYGFGWVRPWSEAGLNAHFVALGVLGALVMLGLLYRLSATLLFLGFTYVFLLEKARYLNHYYLVCLLAFLLIFLPAANAFSLDGRRRGLPSTVPAWSVFLLRSQIGLVYLFAGIAKLNADWLRARPLDEWLVERSGHALLGPLLGAAFTPWFFSYAGLLLDLLAWPLLAWRRSRPWMFLLLLAFHLLNSAVFDIGIFPWLMIAATTIFFEPGWPRWLIGGRPADEGVELAGPRRRILVLNAVALYLIVQVCVPLRHLVYPGDVNWTEEGHLFSWRMKLRDKRADARFTVVFRDKGEQRLVDPREEDLTIWQYGKMACRPDMVHQYAHHLAERLRAPGSARAPEVRAVVRCSLNGREPRDLVDSTVDLARTPRNLFHATWILPLEE